VAVLAYVQVVLGLVLPAYAKYCFEVGVGEVLTQHAAAAVAQHSL
jgi:hypothetical protein